MRGVSYEEGTPHISTRSLTVEPAAHNGFGGGSNPSGCTNISY